jgi:beta-1,4-N-acetylglucosaminyltransferase
MVAGLPETWRPLPALCCVAIVALVAWIVRRWAMHASAHSQQGVHVLAVLGSGGHTAEMLRLLPSLCANEAYVHIDFVLAETDRSSRASADTLREALACTEHPLPPISFHTIPRSREVGQSYVTSLFTTLHAVVHATRTVFSSRPGLILCNGPGTCLPICAIAVVASSLALWPIRIVYVESVARVRSLSLTGRIIWKLGLADAFFVQWPELAVRYPGSKFLGRLC